LFHADPILNLRAARERRNFGAAFAAWKRHMIEVQSARRQMIEQQVRAWDVLDPRVLDAMTRVPREAFVPAPYRELAFADMNVPLGDGQSMLAPKVEGRILQSLAVTPADRVLEVGTGSGYFAACLGQLARDVVSLEIRPALAEFGRANLERNAAHNVTVKVMDAMTLDVDGEYDVIALTGSLPIYDPRFERALRIGGRLFVVVGTGPIMEARLVTRAGHGEWTTESLFETVMDPLLHAPTPPRFVF
jgi:protein-L-isoaspartate(D-aspartate) O-methyltransferase